MTTVSTDKVDALVRCVVYGQDGNGEATCSAKEPLLGYKEHEQGERTSKQSLFQSVRAYSFGLGIFVGILVPFAVLSVNAFFFLHSNLQYKGDEPSTTQLATSILLSGLPTVAFPILVLNLVQELVKAVYHGSSALADSDDELAQRAIWEEWDDLLEQLETRFLVGTVIGLLMAWAIEEMAVGPASQSTFFSVSMFALMGLSMTSAIYYCKNTQGHVSHKQGCSSVV